MQVRVEGSIHWAEAYSLAVYILSSVHKDDIK